MQDRRAAADPGSTNEDAIRQIRQALGEQDPYSVCPECGGNVVQLPLRNDVIVECASGWDWWDAQPTTTRRPKRTNEKRLRIAAAAKLEIPWAVLATPSSWHEFVERGCEICGGSERTRMRLGPRKALAQDHCHKTGRNRGFLCSRCNTALGSFRDDPVLLQNAIAYLAKYRAERFPR